MAHKLRQYGYMRTFSCLGAECEDTCCRGWGMQLDTEHFKKYREEAPELLDAVDTGESEHIMRRDPVTDYCVKFQDGLCGIHAEYDTDFLGDACHFYPRITRQLGDEYFMSGALSCPEVVRLALFGEDAFETFSQKVDRVPSNTKNYLPDGVTEVQARDIQQALLTMLSDEGVTAERSMARLVAVLNGLGAVSPTRWADGIGMLTRMADMRLPEAEPDAMDMANLLVSFYGLLHASKRTARPRLEETLLTIQDMLGITVDRATLEMYQDMVKAEALHALEAHYSLSTVQRKLQPVLRHWLMTQATMANLPFAGFGNALEERGIILAVRFALVRLALICHLSPEGNALEEVAIVRVIQSIARFMDHLEDPTLSLNYYREAGWYRLPRLRALVGDVE